MCRWNSAGRRRIGCGQSLSQQYLAVGLKRNCLGTLQGIHSGDWEETSLRRRRCRTSSRVPRTLPPSFSRCAARSHAFEPSQRSSDSSHPSQSPHPAFWYPPPFCPFFSRARFGVILCPRRTHARLPAPLPLRFAALQNNPAAKRRLRPLGRILLVPPQKPPWEQQPSRFQGAPRETGAENGGFYRVPEFSGFDGLFRGMTYLGHPIVLPRIKTIGGRGAVARRMTVRREGVVKVPMPKTSWTAVAAATAFLTSALPIGRMNQRRKAVAAATAVQGAPGARVPVGFDTSVNEVSHSPFWGLMPRVVIRGTAFR